MPSWKKVITSGSNAHLNQITASSFNLLGSGTGELEVEGNITASGNISSSGNLYVNNIYNLKRLYANSSDTQGYIDFDSAGTLRLKTRVYNPTNDFETFITYTFVDGELHCTFEGKSNHVTVYRRYWLMTN